VTQWLSIISCVSDRLSLFQASHASILNPISFSYQIVFTLQPLFCQVNSFLFSRLFPSKLTNQRTFYSATMSLSHKERNRCLFLLLFPLGLHRPTRRVQTPKRKKRVAILVRWVYILYKQSVCTVTASTAGFSSSR
jgi:hypothetical protein